eukprot:294224-Chlamydomonas_euryale.AAC.1
MPASGGGGAEAEPLVAYGPAVVGGAATTFVSYAGPGRDVLLMGAADGTVHVGRADGEFGPPVDAAGGGAPA